VKCLGHPKKFVRVTEAVSGLPDPPVCSGIPAKRARARALVPGCDCLPLRFQQCALAPFPKNFWLHALQETGSDQADGKAWQVSLNGSGCGQIA